MHRTLRQMAAFRSYFSIRSFSSSSNRVTFISSQPTRQTTARDEHAVTLPWSLQSAAGVPL